MNGHNLSSAIHVRILSFSFSLSPIHLSRSAFPPHTGTNPESKLDLGDTWKQARTFADDLYTCGDVVLEGEDEHRDPSRLVGTSGVDEDEEQIGEEEEYIEEEEEEGFLTPGVLTPHGQHAVVDSDVDVGVESAELEQEHEYEDEYADGHEHEEGEGEHEEEWLEEEEEEPLSPEYSIVPPHSTHHHYPPTAKRGDPIPEDAEIIELDDSEDEGDGQLAEEEKERVTMDEAEAEAEDGDEDEGGLFASEELDSGLRDGEPVQTHHQEQEQEQEELVTPIDTEELFETKSVDVEVPSQVIEPTGDGGDVVEEEEEEAEEVIVVPSLDDDDEPETEPTRAFDTVPVPTSTSAFPSLDPSSLFQPPPPIFSQLSMDSLFDVDVDVAEGILEGLVQDCMFLFFSFLIF